MVSASSESTRKPGGAARKNARSVRSEFMSSLVPARGRGSTRRHEDTKILGWALHDPARAWPEIELEERKDGRSWGGLCTTRALGWVVAASTIVEEVRQHRSDLRVFVTSC